MLERSMEDLRIKTGLHDRLWHLSEATWSVDQKLGQIVFTAPDGTVATCPVQIIGTYNTADSTWLWGWEHPAVRPELGQHAQRVKEYGEAHQISDLTTRKLAATELQCWEFAALACKLNDAQGAYRGPTGPTLVFMTFGQPTLTKAASETEVKEPAFNPDPLADGFTADIPTDVRKAVTGFIAARYNWEVVAWKEDEANRHSRKQSSEEVTRVAEESYAKLIQEWCVPEVKPQPISYGSHPDHDPAKEKLISAKLSGSDCRVRTQATGPYGSVTDYEYQLRKKDGRWLLTHLYFLGDDGKYECL
ncbi:DUF6882 domain-containing protein [Planctomicrobium piriforme]